MIVSRLIELLQECDPEAEVRIMMQENWPSGMPIASATTGSPSRTTPAAASGIGADGVRESQSAPQPGPASVHR